MPDALDDGVGDRRRGLGEIVSTDCPKVLDRPQERLVHLSASAAVPEVPPHEAFLPNGEIFVEVAGQPRFRLGARPDPGTHRESHRLFDGTAAHFDSHHTSGRRRSLVAIAPGRADPVDDLVPGLAIDIAYPCQLRGGPVRMAGPTESAECLAGGRRPWPNPRRAP